MEFVYTFLYNYIVYFCTERTMEIETENTAFPVPAVLARSTAWTVHDF